MRTIEEARYPSHENYVMQRNEAKNQFTFLFGLDLVSDFWGVDHMLFIEITEHYSFTDNIILSN